MSIFFLDQNAVDLAKPEFEGLWDHHKPYTVPKDIDTSPLKIPGASKMDKVCYMVKFNYMYNNSTKVNDSSHENSWMLFLFYNIIYFHGYKC